MALDPSDNLPKSALAKRRRFVLEMARGRRIARAAALAGIGERTAYRWNREPEIREQIAEIQQGMLKRAAGRLAAGAERAAAAMVGLLDSDARPPEIAAKLAVARAILADVAGLQGHVDKAEQLDELTRKVEEHDRVIAAKDRRTPQAGGRAR